MTRLLCSDHLDPWALLRLALGVDELPPVLREPGGKPRFAGESPVQFSLSHSGPYALCALGDTPLGADIEVIRPRRAALPRRALSAEEARWYESRGSTWEDFYTLWTLKEARVKHSGRGLDRRPSAIAVPLLEPGRQAVLDGLTFTAYGGEGWRAALCGGSALPEWV